MNAEAVLVSFTLEGHCNTYETSGILFDPNLVLLTGTALIPLVQEEKWISLFVKCSSSKLEYNPHLEKIYFRVFIEDPKSGDRDESSTQLYSFEGKAIGAWKCPLVSQTSEELFCDWAIGHVNDESKARDPCSDDIDLSKELMSVFILVRRKGGGEFRQSQAANESHDEIPALLNFLSGLGNVNRGQEVEVVSTPFGHKHFVNSLSRGVISNAVGCENCIILSDARTVSGCEGGPMFVAKSSGEKGKLIGMVTCPLTWCRGEWVGLTIGVSLLPVLKKLLRSEEDIATSVRVYESLSTDSLPFKFIDESVVLVRSKDSWGSGVVLDGISGTIITCAHVVRDERTVSVFHMKNNWSADVIFKTEDDVAYDLAIIKIRRSDGNLKEVKFSEKIPKIGQNVIAAGFPFFSVQDDTSIRPTVVTGCISRVNPHMIQTTCCIQSGFSGGPLLLEGELLGIIISNTRGSGALFPHLNFIVPSSVFREPFLKYLKKNDLRSLKNLESSNSQVQSLWKLHSSKL